MKTENSLCSRMWIQGSWTLEGGVRLEYTPSSYSYFTSIEVVDEIFRRFVLRIYSPAERAIMGVDV